MREREQKERKLITSKEDILERYPGLFTEQYLDEQSYYLENGNPQKLGLFRFILFPTGIVAVSSFRNDYIWDIEQDKYKDMLFLTIHEIAKDKIESNTTNIKDLVQELHFNTEEYFLRILPYSDRHSSDVTTSILDKRYDDIQNQLPLTQI
ncbi:MAG TPA: hypothetical protein PKH06_02870 [Candidatus Dojkabacteria bacterium]|nr:hypothetical protein [Candidatus Dojkabacteria bacterium]